MTPRAFQYGLGSGIATVLSGTLLYLYLDFAPGSPGLSFIQSGALIAFLILILIIPPAVARRTVRRIGRLSEQLAKISQGPPSDPKAAADMRSSIARLQRRLRVNGLVNLVFLVIVLGLMVVGRSI